jgi:hypothetical protein
LLKETASRLPNSKANAKKTGQPPPPISGGGGTLANPLPARSASIEPISIKSKKPEESISTRLPTPENSKISSAGGTVFAEGVPNLALVKARAAFHAAPGNDYGIGGRLVHRHRRRAQQSGRSAQESSGVISRTVQHLFRWLAALADDVPADKSLHLLG